MKIDQSPIETGAVVSLNKALAPNATAGWWHPAPPPGRWRSWCSRFPGDADAPCP